MSSPASVGCSFPPLFRYPAAAHALATKKLRALLRAYHRRRFLRGAASLFDDVGRPEDFKAVFAVCNSGFQQCTGWYSFLGRELAKKGIAPVFLMEVPPVRPYRNPDLADLEGALLYRTRALSHHRRRPDGQLNYRWNVLPETGEVSADGLNFFPVMRCMLRRDFRRYRIDFSAPEVVSYLRNLVVTADAALTVCNDLVERFARKGKPVRIIGAEPNYVPSGVFQIYCAERGKALGIEFLDIGNAYIRYFDLSENQDGWLSIGNLTREGILNRDEPEPARFGAWLEEGQDGKAAMNWIQSIVRQDRTQTGIVPEAEAVLERVRAHRAAGGRVAVIFGHLALDLGAFSDCGPAHEDMTDWINHTIRALVDTDVLLLIKPHIAEVRHKANHKPKERMADLIEAPLPDNAVLLEPTWFNAFQLFPEMDFGLVWRSTVAVELLIAGIPSIVACSSAPYWRCLDLPRFSSRAEYESLLRNVRRDVLSPRIAERAALFLKYQREHKCIPVKYITRHVSGPFKGSCSWTAGGLAALRTGDDHVAQVAALAAGGIE